MWFQTKIVGMIDSQWILDIFSQVNSRNPINPHHPKKKIVHNNNLHVIAYKLWKFYMREELSKKG